MCGFLYSATVVATYCLLFRHLTTVLHWAPLVAGFTSLAVSLFVDAPLCVLVFLIANLVWYRDKELAVKHCNEELEYFHPGDAVGSVLFALLVITILWPVFQKARRQHELQTRATGMTVPKH